MTLDPNIKFLIGIFITLCIGIAGGTVNLTHAIPENWVPAVEAWSGVIAFVGSSIQTTLQGFGTTAQSRISAASSLPQVNQIVTTDKKLADSLGEKVVTPS